jgi:hypothetical protein
MGWARGTYGEEIGVYVKARDYLEDLGVDGRIILKWIFSK